MAKKLLENPVDCLNRPITVGCYVTYTMLGHLYVGEVIRFGAKQLSIARIPKAKWKAIPDAKYPTDVTIVPSEAVMLWQLTSVQS